MGFVLQPIAFVVIALSLLSGAFAVSAHAQTGDQGPSRVSARVQASSAAPSAADIDALRADIAGAEALDDARTEALDERLIDIEARLQAARETRAEAARFEEIARAAPARLEAIDRDTLALVESGPPVSDVEALGTEAGGTLSGVLAEAEGRLTALRSELESRTREIERLAQRQTQIIDEEAQAREQMSLVIGQIDAIGANPEELETRVDLAELRSRRTFRQSEIDALQVERRTRTQRLQLAQAERDLLQLRVERTAAEIETLQRLTGQQRLREIDAYQRRNLTPMVGETVHPLVEAEASANAAQIGRLRALAVGEADLPQERARVQARLGEVSSNLSIARQLTEIGDLDRRAGETLRRLRASVPALSSLRADRERTRQRILAARQDQLLAQQQLRQTPVRPDADALLEAFRREVPDPPALDAPAEAALRDLYALRREVLSDTVEAASRRSEDAERLLSLQTDLLDQSEDLSTTLDQNLLWLPSAEPIYQTAWPGKLWRGTLKLAQPPRAGAVLVTLRRQAVRFWPVALLWLIVVGVVFRFRPRFREDLRETARSVRKVREDNYFNTPRAVLASVLIATPLPLLVALAAWLLARGDAANAFVLATADALWATALFLFTMLSLRVFSADEGLFGKHIGLPADLRRGLLNESHWFIPVAGTAFALFLATHESRDVDVYEGVSVTAFLATALSLGLFLYRLLWGRREAFTKSLDPDTALYRYRKLVIFTVVGVPFLTAVAASLGYFATAEQFFARLLWTGAGAIALFVLFGVLRRSVNIAHRRLSLKQATEKREAALEARRREREAAQSEDGGINKEAEAPPPVDYEQIDLEESSRQTRQLLRTVTVLGFLGLMWLVWRDLLPALGALDAVELYRNGEATVGEGEDAIRVPDYITLWDLVQALVTIVITVLAARNLPGFLEIFVLNRTNLDRGLRYALVTVLGYLIVAVGIVIAFGQLGLEWSQFAIIGGALALGIGFGLQEIIANFVSGLIILFERPIRVGDYVTVGDQSGTVSNIKIRATTLTDLDNKEILIPNKEFITGRVTNWTLTNSVIRVIIPVGIAYGSDTQSAQKIMLEVLQKESKILQSPGPQVIFVNFGDSSLDFELRVFIRTFEDRFPVINAVHTSINRALEEAGISIPFPQRDLHLVSADARLAVDVPPAKVAQAAKAPNAAKAAAGASAKGASKSKPAASQGGDTVRT